MKSVHFSVFFAATALAAGCQTGASGSSEKPSDKTGEATQALACGPQRTILHHGRIFTADPAHPWAEAIAIEGDHIVEVGTNAALLAHLPPGTKQIALGGRAVIPGINDAHVHVVVPEGAAVNDASFAPGPGPTVAEMKAMIAAKAAATPPGTWIVGYMGTNIFEDAQTDRFALDAVAAGHPVVLFAWSGHGTWLDTAGMKALGISETEPDPFGGHFERVGSSAVLNGKAHEYAEFQIRRKLLGLLPDTHLVAQYRAFAQQAVKFGYTSIQDMGIGFTRERSMSVLRTADLPLRVRSICFPLNPNESCDIPHPPHGQSDSPLLRAMGVKWISDGTPIERNAFVEIDYADAPGNHGVFNLGTTPLHGMLLDAKKGSAEEQQRLFHSVGDAAIGKVLDAMEDTGGPNTWHDRRTRIEHGDMLFPSDYARAKKLGVVITQNATHLALAPVWQERFTPAVLADLEPLKTLLDQGIPLALGTDGIGVAFSPFVDMFLATVHPAHPSEAITIEQAVTAYTRGSAYAEFQESKKGTLAPGKLADIAVLSQDIFHPVLPDGGPMDITQTASLLTIVNGNVVWDAGAL